MSTGLNINELNLDNVGQWPVAVKIGFILVLSILLIFTGYWFIVKDNFEEYDRLEQIQVGLKEDFEKVQLQASNLQAYRNQMVVMEERFGNMLKKLPTKNEMPGLLEDISKTGIASGLEFELFAPQSEVQHDFYIELPIKITVVGTYHQLAVFLSRVADMNRIVTLHDLSVKSEASRNKVSRKNGLLVMDITATIYRYRTQ